MHPAWHHYRMYMHAGATRQSDELTALPYINLFGWACGNFLPLTEVTRVRTGLLACGLALD